MNTPYTHRYVLRAVIQFTAPFLIGAGREGDIADAVFVADANGLPAIPGSSLAGVLRSAFRAAGHGANEEDLLFGYQNGKAGAGSKLTVSWGCIHDSHNRPVEGIVKPQDLDDPVLAKAMSPMIRDHVRISHRGASDAEGHGKFDEQAVCAGHRFTFELELRGDKTDQSLWNKLLAVVADPALRLGGKTRRGFGVFVFDSVKSRVYDLHCDFDAYRQHPVSLALPSPCLPDLSKMPAAAEFAPDSIRLTLKPHGYWMFGGGYDLPDVPGEADMAPVRDCRVEWKDNAGRIVEDLLVIPATGLKGALAHRVAFHYNALTGVFADSLAEKRPEDVTAQNNLAVRELFGYCKGKQEDGAEETGQRGRVLLNDLYLSAESPSQLVHHVGIDRFTGGARDQVLFCERPLWQGEPLEVTIQVVDARKLEGKSRQALRLAVQDLTEGRLQVGAGAGRGLGYFTGTVMWPESLKD